MPLYWIGNASLSVGHKPAPEPPQPTTPGRHEPRWISRPRQPTAAAGTAWLDEEEGTKRAKPIMRPAATAPARPSCPRDRALLPCHLRSCSCSWWPLSRAATSRTLALLCFACLRADFGAQKRQRRALTRRMTRLTKIAAVSLARSLWPWLAFASGFGCR